MGNGYRLQVLSYRDVVNSSYEIEFFGDECVVQQSARGGLNVNNPRAKRGVNWLICITPKGLNIALFIEPFQGSVSNFLFPRAPHGVIHVQSLTGLQFFKFESALNLLVDV